MSVLSRYEEERERFLSNCTQCGLCAEGCPILPHTDERDGSFQGMQGAVYDFLNGGVPGHQVYTKAFACMECFKCTSGMCPEDLNPLMMNELVKGEYIANGWAGSGFSDPRKPDGAHRVLAGIQVSGPEYDRITTSGGKTTARHVFFPGCNVYFQPEKILNALDIMDAIGTDYAFLPGLDHCCGDSRFYFGAIEEGSRRAEELVTALAGFDPETVVLWCPTCHCRFETIISPAMDVPFKIQSFPQYLADRMNELPLTFAAAGTVTLHEACKSAYTGVDTDGPRRVLRQLPGVNLKEMKRHGPETVCCGSGAIGWFPESCDRVRRERLEEAAQTGAERLVAVCHYCNQTFAAEEPHYDFKVVNYVNLVARALGIHRDDKFKRYTLWRDLDRILEDAEANIAQSPFERERIVEVLRSVFIE